MIRRRVTQLVLLLIAGAIVNVAVAWGCALWLDPFRPPFGSWSIQLKRTEYAHLSFRSNEIPGAQVRHYAPGVFYIDDNPRSPWLHERRAHWEADQPFDESFENIFDARGWPCVALWSQTVINTKAAECVCGIHIKQTTGKEEFPFLLPVCFPLRPIWRGFAINSIFYTAILSLLFSVPLALRRRRRMKRGQCPACAYPVGRSPVCTECGKPVRQKAEIA